MATQSRADLKEYFEEGDTPDSTQFGHLIDSFVNLSDTGVQTVQGTLSASLVGADQLEIQGLAFSTTTTNILTGSNFFGSGSGNLHKITGSIKQSGSVNHFLSNVIIGDTLTPQKEGFGGLTISNSLTMAVSPHHQSQSISSSFLITQSNTYGHLAFDSNEILQWHHDLVVGSFGGDRPNRGNIKFYTSVGEDSAATGSTKMFISASGRVGIGTIVPDELLEVEGSVDGDDIAIKINNTSDDDSTATRPSSALLLNAASNNAYLRCHAAPAEVAANHQIDLGSTATNSFLTFSPHGAERMRITNGGNVGIGTDAPGEKLHVEGNISASGTLNASCSAAPTHHAGILAIVYDTGSDQFHYTGSYGAGGGSDSIFAETGSYYSATENVKITGSFSVDGDIEFQHNVLIKQHTPKLIIHDTSDHDDCRIEFLNNQDQLEFQIAGGGHFSSDNLLDTTSPSQTFMIGTVASRHFSLETNDTERIRINSDGKVGIGRVATTYQLEVGGDMAASADVIAYLASDKRLKDNIKPIENPIEKIKQIGGYTFDWNDNQSTYEGNDVGVIAQEIEKVLPSLVNDRENGYKGVKYDKIVSLLIEGIKDQQNQIDDLKEQINNLK